MPKPLEWTRKSYWRAKGPDGNYVAKDTGSSNFSTPEELWEAIANSPLKGLFDVEPARYQVSKAYGVLAPGGDVIAPSVPANLSGGALHARRIDLSWDESTDNVGVSAYQVYRNGVPIGSSGTNSYSDTTVVASTAYSYQVSASDAAGNSSALSSAAAVTTPANTAPAWSTSSQSLTIGQAYSLNLNSVCSDTEGDTLTFTQVSGTLPTGLSFAAPTISGTPTTAQAPSVTFRANDGTTTTDQAITFTVTQADTTAPSTPTGLTVGTVTSTTIPMTWTANPEGEGVAAYKLYRSTDGASYGLRATITSPTVSYTDTGLNAGTTYYYKLSAVDSATPVANESAQTSAVSGTTTSVAPDWIAGLPAITFTQGVADDFDFYPTYVNLSNTSVSVETGTLPTGVTLPAVTPPVLRYNGTSPVASASGISFRVSSTAQADWQSRISAAGVVWYHNFQAQAEVNRFRWQGAIGNCLNDGTGDGSCTWNATGGPNGNGCMDITIPAGGTSAQGWVRPFSPLTGATNGKGVDDPGASPLAWNVTNNTDYTGTWKNGMYAHADNQSFSGWTFDGNEFYIQFRCKLTANRALSGQPSGKLAFIGITGNGTSHITPIQEIVLQSNRSLLSRAYTNFGSSFNSALNEPQEANDSSGTIKQPGGAYLGTCINNLSCAICGCYPVDEWFTVLVHIRPGHHGTSLSQTSAQDTLFELKVAMDGDTDYTTVYSKSNYVISFRSGTPQGWNAFEPSGYMNNVAALPGFGWTQSFAEVIFSTQPIACPQV